MRNLSGFAEEEFRVMNYLLNGALPKGKSGLLGARAALVKKVGDDFIALMQVSAQLQDNIDIDVPEKPHKAE